MHWYRFHIKDYVTDTMHLSPIEDIAYRRMLDWLYLHQKSLPNDAVQIARLIRMPDQHESVAVVVSEFFRCNDHEVWHPRVKREVDAYVERQEKGRESAQKRWGRDGLPIPDPKGEQCQVDANHKPLTNNHNKNTRRRFTPPTVDEVRAYCQERGNTIDPETFIDYYQSIGWVLARGKPVKDWKACVRRWEKNEINAGKALRDDGKLPTRELSLADELSDRSWAE